MDENKKKYVHFIAISSSGSWARSDTLKGALNRFGSVVVRGKKAGTLRADYKTIVYRITQTDDNRIDEESVKMYSNWGGGPWNVGDLWLPAVDDFGQLWYRGEKELIAKNYVDLDECEEDYN